jgi:nucleoside-diphosphate-sugar epimerase
MMDFLYLEDAASAFLKALHHTTPGAENYLTIGDYRQISEVFDFVRSLFPQAPIRLEMADAPLPAGSSMVWRNKFDGSRAAVELGYKGQVSLEEGLLRTMNENRATVGLPPLSHPETHSSPVKA